MKARWVIALLLGALALSGCSAAGSASLADPTTRAEAQSAPMPLPESTLPADPSGNDDTEETMVFAVVGDYGMDNEAEAAVAALVDSWDPEFVLSTGDNYDTDAGGKGTGRYDESTGAYWGRWLRDIRTTGKRLPRGRAEVNAFFPVLGNHDYSDASLKDYLTYFRLPGDGFKNSSGNERYYDFTWGDVHFFALNSNPEEPDGTDPESKQALWLKTQLAASEAPWNIVYDHHAPFSSDGRRGSAERMQWPYPEWGADAVLSGHAHTYERIMRDGFPYFINGLGGSSLFNRGAWYVDGSVIRYLDDWGAQKVTVTPDAMTLELITVGGELIDSYTIEK